MAGNAGYLKICRLLYCGVPFLSVAVRLLLLDKKIDGTRTFNKVWLLCVVHNIGGVVKMKHHTDKVRHPPDNSHLYVHIVADTGNCFSLLAIYLKHHQRHNGPMG